MGNEPCERCIRLKAECKSSPSLRFRRPGNKLKGSQDGVPERETCLTKPSSSGTLPISGASPGDFSALGVMDETPETYANHNYNSAEIYQKISYAQLEPQIETIYACELDRLSASVPNTSSFSSPDALPLDKALTACGASTESWMYSEHTVYATQGMSQDLLTVEGEADGWKPQVSSFSIPAPPAPCNGNIVTNPFLSHECPILADHQSFVGLHLQQPNYEELIQATASSENVATRPATTPRKNHCQQPQTYRKRHPNYTNITTATVAGLSDINTMLWELGMTVPVPPSPDNIMAAMTTATGLITVSTTPPNIMGATETLKVHGSGCRGYDERFSLHNLFSLSQCFLQTLQATCLMSTSTREGDKGHAQAERNSSSLALVHSACAGFLAAYDRLLHLVSATATSAAAASAAAATITASSGLVGSSYGNTRTPSEATADVCLRLCRLPDVTMGNVPIASTPSMQLELALHLVDEFLVHFSHVVVAVQNAWIPTMDQMAAERDAILGRQEIPCPTAPYAAPLFGFTGSTLNNTIANSTAHFGMTSLQPLDDIIAEGNFLRGSLMDLKMRLESA